MISDFIFSKVVCSSPVHCMSAYIGWPIFIFYFIFKWSRMCSRKSVRHSQVLWTAELNIIRPCSSMTRLMYSLPSCRRGIFFCCCFWFKVTLCLLKFSNMLFKPFVSSSIVWRCNPGVVSLIWKWYWPSVIGSTVWYVVIRISIYKLTLWSCSTGGDLSACVGKWCLVVTEVKYPLRQNISVCFYLGDLVNLKYLV